MWKKKTIVLLSILLGISISGCSQQVSVAEMTTSVEKTTTQEETTTTKEVAVETTQLLLLESEEETINEPEEEVETTKEIEDEKLKSCMAMFNGRKGEIDFSEEEKEANNYLVEQGYVVLFVNTDEEKNIGKVVTRDEAYTFYEDEIADMYYQEGWKGTSKNKEGGRTSEADKILSEVMNKKREKNEKEQAQNFNNEVASHIKPGGGVALVINDLNPYGASGYTTNSMGYVVPTNASFMHYEELRKSKDPTYKLYYEIDRQVYAQNNQGKVNIIKKYTLPRLSYPVGTVNEEGIPLWVQRDNNFEVVNAHGEVFYCNCAKTFPDLSVFCGGTTTSFNGWGQFKTLDFNAYYDWIAVKGGSFGTGCLVDATQDNVDMMGLDQYTYVINYLNSIGSTIPGRP